VFLKKLNIEPPYSPAIPLNVYPKELKAGAQINTWTPLFRAALFFIAKKWKQFKYLSTDEQINHV
jgi:hypothetical protein